MKLYFFSDKNDETQQNCSPRPCGNTCREPAFYTVQCMQNGTWVAVPGQEKTPDEPWASYSTCASPGSRRR